MPGCRKWSVGAGFTAKQLSTPLNPVLKWRENEVHVYFVMNSDKKLTLDLCVHDIILIYLRLVLNLFKLNHLL